MKKILIVAFFILFGILAFANHNVIVVHTSGGNHGFDQISVDPPTVTYDDDLNELYVYFGSTSTIDLEYLDGRESYALPPINMLDYAALQHDLGYDKLGKRGIMGVLSLFTAKEDILLTLRSINAMSSYSMKSGVFYNSLMTAMLFGNIANIKVRLGMSIPLIGPYYLQFLFHDFHNKILN